jgi:hypothetical protein
MIGKTPGIVQQPVAAVIRRKPELFKFLRPKEVLRALLHPEPYLATRTLAPLQVPPVARAIHIPM